jgi:hypothetical protein
VTIADSVPESAPEMKDVVSGDRVGWVIDKCVLRISNPAQYKPLRYQLDDARSENKIQYAKQSAYLRKGRRAIGLDLDLSRGYSRLWS